MGEGSTSSYRWDNDRKPTLQEQITFWQTRFAQMKSERDYQVQQNENLAIRLATTERQLSQYQNIVFMKADKLPDKAAEPFSQ